MEGFDYVRRMATLEPFKSGIVGEVDPGADKQSDEDIKGECVTVDAMI